MDFLNIAISKGRIGKEAYNLFKEVGIGDSINLNSRKLIFKDEENKINYIYVKSSDVLTYVENGVADLGIVGKDTILENEADVYEIFDLGLGKCKFVVAGIKEQHIYCKDQVLKVATKYPNIAKKYFDKKSKKIKLIKLSGSVELAPLVGLSDVIVDLVQTGNTLKANNLQIIEEMFDISTRLVCNRISYRFKYDIIANLIQLLKGREN